jgi:2-polyprenyl-6-methoxyphenol hydroxylase-like FAD-dependent oxidoreductase
LTAALCMLKKGFDVTVYEKTSAFARFGGPIQFASNALSVLKEIDDVLFDRVMEKFTFTGIRTCGIKDGTKQWSARQFWCFRSVVYLFSLCPSLITRSSCGWLIPND